MNGWMKYALSTLFLPLLTGAAPAGPLSAAAETEAAEWRPDSGPVIDSVVASVNGEPISLSDILPVSRAKEYSFYAAYSGKDLYDAVLAERKRVLEEMIGRKLLVKEYRSAPFEIPPQYIESYLDDLAQNAGVRSRREFADLLRAAGTDLAELRRKAEEMLIIQAMSARRMQVAVNITPKMVFDYFEAHRSGLTRPEQWRLGMILVPASRADADRVITEISDVLSASPTRFGELAGRFSSGPNADKGGDLGLIERPRLRPEFAAAITGAAAGRVYGPVSAAEGTYFLCISEIVPAQEPDFKALEPGIREKLEQEAREKAIREHIEKLKAEAVIRYYL